MKTVHGSHPIQGVTLQLLRQERSLGAETDLNRGIDLLGKVSRGESPALLRLYRPQPTVAFGQRDTRLSGFEDAWQEALNHGFEPAVRRAGGRAAAYHQGTLVVDHIQPESDAIAHAKERFGFFGELFAQTMRNIGVRAGVGEIPQEYCPGEFSVYGLRPGAGPEVSAATAVKLVGTAQRVVSGAWLFSSVIVVENSAPVREVLIDCYQAMGLTWDPRTAGAVNDLKAEVTVDAVEKALLEVYRDFVKIT